jgi:hypothetical protein
LTANRGGLVDTNAAGARNAGRNISNVLVMTGRTSSILEKCPGGFLEQRKRALHCRAERGGRKRRNRRWLTLRRLRMHAS